jgi:hypothetical protein
MSIPPRTVARLVIACLASIPVLAVQPARAETSTIFDGTFFNGNWTMVVRPYGPGGGSGAGTQVATGGAGDNGPARQVTNSCGNNNSGAYNASIQTSVTYRPAADGAILGFALSVDSRHLGSLCALGAVVQQGDDVWMLGYAINTPAWTTYTFTPDLNGPWFQIHPTGAVLGPGPDLSASGAPLRFGFYTGNGSGPGNFGYTTTSLMDNFTVVVEHLPGCPSDLDGDAVVTGADLGLLLSNWGGPGAGDVDLNGTVDGADLGMMLAAWGPCG